MKYCPICERNYDDDVEVCKLDGAVLRGAGAKHDPFIGQVINGRYRVIRKLGEGGMGTVYLAEQVSLGKKVALKVLQGQYARDEEFVRRFRHEARLAASVNHRNVVTVYDFDQADEGSLFIAMEYVEGRSLREVIQGGPLDMRRAVRLGMQIAEGLGAAHRAGVIHRDVKPENVMVMTGKEEIKLMDFGIARLRETETVTRLTRSGVVMGTPDYMAPEQIQEGGEISERTDIYAFGIVLYEMLSGGVPFRASTPAAVLIKHLQEPPLSLRKLRREIPSSVERVVKQALEKKPQKRQKSMEEVVEGLKKVESTVVDGKIPATVVIQPLRRTGWELVVVVSILLAVFAAGVLGWAIGGISLGRLVAGKSARIEQHLASGKLHLERGEYAEAFAEFEKAREIDSENQEVLEQLEQAQKEKDTKVRDLLVTGKFHLDRGDYNEAISELEKAKAIDPGNQEVLDHLEKARLAQEAERRLFSESTGALHGGGSSVDDVKATADVRVEDKASSPDSEPVKDTNPTTATAPSLRLTEERSERSTSEPAGWGEIRQMIAYASVDGGINREQEIAAAKQRIEALNLKSQIPKVPRENRKKVRDYNQKGLEFVVKGQIAEAVQAFRAAYQEDRGDVEILNNLGDTLARNGEWDAAEQYLFSTLLFAPGRAIAWANLGYTYAKQSKTTSAVACFANAYRFSRNRETTYQLFQKLMAEDDDAKVRDVALQVLQLELVRAGRSEVTNR